MSKQYIRNDSNRAILQAIGGARFDASYGQALDLQLQAIEAEVYNVKYQDLKFRDWLPLKTDVPPGAESFAYYIQDMFGKAEHISPRSDNIPMVGVRREKRIGNIAHIGIGYGYSLQDLRAAALYGSSLDADEAKAAMRGVEQLFNDDFLLGNLAFGFTGFFTDASYQTLTATGSWGSITGDQMLADIRRLATQVRLQSQGVFEATQIILPLSSYNQLFNKPVNTAGSAQDTVGRVFQLGNASPIQIGWDVNLEAAGASGAKRAIAYQKSADVVQAVISMEPLQGEPQLKGLSWNRIIEARDGGTVVRQPLGIAVLDGI